MSDGRDEFEPVDDLLVQAADKVLPPGLLARVVEDAEVVAAQRRPAAPTESRFARVLALFRDLGGWPSMAGLAAASVAGIALGLAEPGLVWPLDGVSAAGAFDVVDLAPGYGLNDAWGD